MRCVPPDTGSRCWCFPTRRLRSAGSTFKNGNDSGSLDFSHTTPVLGVLYKLTPALNVYASAARGFAHIGVIKALDAAGIRPDLIVGCSAGALVGAFWAAGVNGEKMEALAHALLRLENCICTPHIGYVEQDSYEQYFNAAFDNLLNFINGTPTNIVNPEALLVKR